MIATNKPCFFMLCTNQTEKECLEKSLFGDREWRLPYLKSIKKGDIGFLLNLSKNQLLGIFIAESEAKLNIDPTAWGGKFLAQVKVKLIGELQRVDDASQKLKEFVKLRKIKNYEVPAHNSYGPEITKQILSLFKIDEEIKKHIELEQREVGNIPQYSLDDVAGLDEVKKFIYQRIIAPFEDEETAGKLGLRIGGGILLFGPPGTGKTLLAMAVANSLEAKFIDISPSVIIGYPGEAEKRIENIFASLEREPRGVVFLDEAEWILCKRDEQTSSVMQRVTPVLLAQLSRIFKDKRRPILVIAATNKPEMIDPAFLRPGRFDKIFYVGLPDKKARGEILRIHLRDRENTLNESDFSELTDRLEGYSGADIEYIIEESAYRAFERREKGEAKITKDDILKVIDKTPKSVKQEEIDRMMQWATKMGLKI